ncbi:MAG: transketolase [Sphingobacteriia bacterium 24-36-13]|jgi:transketolase|uniref:transketolase family protein n=1 Tax=Sediminibacterium sp. TaxID=1917865 RepID=UPI000BD04F90|nr:transketolase family protein [Sediminibacterium sp.]OYY08628.1 MAG: transketolase [Sphingobacteriia bacterium 35-36-14]OYZ53714.1 MAG: transketolase [Sphingobacteriia bacterium 24-36-13]OZA62799.1 MAG: transketolase [Sphingobacteriia bacterium 39-36-14]HQS24853.1 transketolase family protein [Sediminibacterium sp.]HQS36410.1 transketolase family protein [Sediminibacterium sp.]
MKLKDIQVLNEKETRGGFGEGIHEIGKENPNVVVLTADLAGSLKLGPFIKDFPDRFVQVGIAEANMIGIAAGMTIGGKIPYTTTFANFSTGRVYDQIRQSVAYSEKNVKICASHAGLTLGEDGATHQILEDIGLMKMLPGMTVIVPCDFNQTKAATKAIASYKGPVYLRFGRPKWPNFTKEDGSDFVIGKAQQLSEGTDVTIFACGHMVWKAIEAGRILEEKGISVELINIHTIKPLDTEAVINSIVKTKCAVTVEEHNIIGGLGDAIAQVAAKNCPIPIELIGTNDTFGESGKPTELLTKYGLDTPFIVAAVEKVMARK